MQPTRATRPVTLTRRLADPVSLLALAAVVALGGVVGLPRTDVRTVPAATSTALVAVPEQPRIMLLGDSITAGVGSVTGTGFRDDLALQLSAAGVVAQFVGSQGTTSSPHLDHEGHRGWRIDQIDARVNGWMAASTPDVVLLNIGSNDYVRRFRTATAPARLSALVSRILATSPTVRVVVAKLLVPTGAERAAGVRAYNATIPAMVASKGSRVTLVDLARISNVNTIDGLHPDDLGYRQMSHQWFHGLRRVLTGGASWPSTLDPFPVPTVRLSRPAAALPKGATAELTARLVGILTATDLGRVPVQLLFCPDGSTTWSVLQTARTAPNGQVVFRRRLDQAGSFTARVAGGAAAGRQSAAVRVAIRP